MYISSIQKGIQTAHVVGDLAYLYLDNNVFKNWCKHDKTIIVLNGGNCSKLHEFGELIYDLKYPHAEFHEDGDSLNNAITAVGIILPESVYLGKSKNKKDKEIYNWIKDLPLAV
jgi:hypothetical protein